MQIREINLYSIGDSGKASTWSNVPYFFSRQLELQGIKVNRINLAENQILSKIYRYSVYPFLKLFYPQNSHNYFRHFLHYQLTLNRIKTALKKYPDANLQVVMSFSFSSKPLSNTPCVLFGDWTYLYLIEKLQKRKALWFEKNAVNREALNINEADLVISLFPKSDEFVGAHFNPKKHNYLGNVVNSELRVETKELLRQKLVSRKILFIGNQKYLKAAKNLLIAFGLLPPDLRPGTELHFIGLLPNEIGRLPDSVYAHGYLDKSSAAERTLYYDLLCSARVVVNSQQDWGAFSSLTEAMYYGTPVICSPFEEFAATYGSESDFGYYLQDGTTEELMDKIRKILVLNTEDYTSLVLSARDKTRNFTWENFTRTFLEEASKLNNPTP